MARETDWIAKRGSGDGEEAIGILEGNRLVANVAGRDYAERKARADLIVTAVNSHADLLAALEGLLTVDWNLEHQDFYDPGTYPGKVWANVRTAIAKARA